MEAQAKASEAASDAEVKKNKSLLESQEKLEQLKTNGKSQILSQESAIKEKLMQLEFPICNAVKTIRSQNQNRRTIAS